jgi:tellurite resistance protein
VFAAVTIVLAGWMTDGWIVEDLDLEKEAPRVRVAGGRRRTHRDHRRGPGRLVGSGPDVLRPRRPVLADHRLGHPDPPVLPPAAAPQLKPNLAIEVAPPAPAGLAYLAVTRGRVDAVAFALAGYPSYRPSSNCDLSAGTGS